MFFFFNYELMSLHSLVCLCAVIYGKEKHIYACRGDRRDKSKYYANLCGIHIGASYIQGETIIHFSWLTFEIDKIIDSFVIQVYGQPENTRHSHKWINLSICDYRSPPSIWRRHHSIEKVYHPLTLLPLVKHSQLTLISPSLLLKPLL